MGTVRNFEDLEIWKLSRELVNLIYKDFRCCKDLTFKNQITASGISTMNNISEGYCRNSDREFRFFLNISKASSDEVKSMYYIAEDQKYVTDDIAIERRNRCQSLMNCTSKLMTYLKQSKV